MEKSLDKLRYVASIAYSNKFKLIFILGSLFLIKKAYNMYKFIKPILDALGGGKNLLGMINAGGAALGGND